MDLAAIRARLAEIQDYLDSIETCHVCGGTLVLEEYAPHCENCSWDCDEHDEPSCEAPFYKHDKAKRAVAALLDALDAKAQQEADRENRSNKESAKIPCPKCHGSGFTGRGSGYDDVCDCTGGYIGYVETQEKDG